MHVDDILDVTVTDHGYLVRHDTTEGIVSELVDEDDIALMIYIENDGILHEEQPADQPPDPIIDAMAMGQVNRAKLAVLYEIADQHGMANLVRSIVKYAAVDIERWKSDGDLIKLDAALTKHTGKTIRKALDTPGTGGLSVQQHIIRMLA